MLFSKDLRRGTISNNFDQKSSQMQVRAHDLDGSEGLGNEFAMVVLRCCIDFAMVLHWLCIVFDDFAMIIY